VRVVKRQHLPTHLLLGVGAVDAAQDYSRRQVAEAEAWRRVSTSADFGRPYPVELPADEVQSMFSLIANQSMEHASA
jgi:hypothetical protein